jgi:hypothetical protein
LLFIIFLLFSYVLSFSPFSLYTALINVSQPNQATSTFTVHRN